MRPQRGHEMVEVVKTPCDVFLEVGLLIVEARMPEPSVKGRVEGPHCPTVSRGIHHVCNKTDEQCKLVEEITGQMHVLWKNHIPLCIEVLLFPTCCHGNAAAASIDAGGCATEYTDALLLERWDVQMVAKRHYNSESGGMSSVTLLQALRSYLHFSQLSSWLNASHGDLPGRTVYRLYAPGETVCYSFRQKPEFHTFPPADIGPVTFKVSVTALSRLPDMPALYCRHPDHDDAYGKKIPYTEMFYAKDQRKRWRDESASDGSSSDLKLSYNSETRRSRKEEYYQFGRRKGREKGATAAAAAATIKTYGEHDECFIADSHPEIFCRNMKLLPQSRLNFNQSADDKLLVSASALSDTKSSLSATNPVSLSTSTNVTYDTVDLSHTSFSLTSPTDSTTLRPSSERTVRHKHNIKPKDLSFRPQRYEFQQETEICSDKNITRTPKKQDSPKVLFTSTASCNQHFYKRRALKFEDPLLEDSFEKDQSLERFTKDIITKPFTSSLKDDYENGSAPVANLMQQFPVDLQEKCHDRNRIEQAYSHEKCSFYIGDDDTHLQDSSHYKDTTSECLRETFATSNNSSIINPPTIPHPQHDDNVCACGYADEPKKTIVEELAAYDQLCKNIYHQTFDKTSSFKPSKAYCGHCHSYHTTTAHCVHNKHICDRSSHSEVENIRQKIDEFHLSTISGTIVDGVLRGAEVPAKQAIVINSEHDNENSSMVSDHYLSEYQSKPDAPVDDNIIGHDQVADGHHQNGVAVVNVRDKDVNDVTQCVSGIEIVSNFNCDITSMSVSTATTIPTPTSAVTCTRTSESTATLKLCAISRSQHQEEFTKGSECISHSPDNQGNLLHHSYSTPCTYRANIIDSIPCQNGHIETYNNRDTIAQSGLHNKSSDSHASLSDDSQSDFTSSYGSPEIREIFLNGASLGKENSSSILHNDTKTSESRTIKDDIHTKKSQDFTSDVGANAESSSPLSDSWNKPLSLQKSLLRRDLHHALEKCATDAASVPTRQDEVIVRRLHKKSHSMIFPSSGAGGGLPTRSSPAPIKRKSSGKFEYDCTLTSVRAIKNAISCSKLSLHCDDSSTDTDDDDSRQQRLLSTSAPASTNCLLGNFEESMLNGRIEPVGIVDGFSAEIGASGSFCPRHMTMPVIAYFFSLSDDNAPSPYLGHINLEPLGKKGYHVPKKGTVQVTLFNPNKTVVKMFVVQYNLSAMPPNCQTFLRQRTLYMPVSGDETSGVIVDEQPSYLRYLIHLRFVSSKTCKIYLHTDIRLIFARDKFEFDPRVANYELRSFTEAPSNPQFSPKR